MEQSHLYRIELLYKEQPTLDVDALLAKLQTGFGQVDRMIGDSQPSAENLQFLAFAFLDHGEPVPPQVMIGTGFRFSPDAEAVTQSLQQTWQWANAKEVIAECRSSVMINEFMAHFATYQTRLALIRHTALAIHEIAPCQAIHWMPSQQIVNPAQIIASQQKGDPLYPGVNVRLFNIQNRQPGETLMDTVGLFALGLPDLQCHFIGLDPDQVANVLYGYAYYLFEQGDVIEDGNTVQGTIPGSKWTCHHEISLVAPEREVLDIDPGQPYAAGDRDD